MDVDGDWGWNNFDFNFLNVSATSESGRASRLYADTDNWHKTSQSGQFPYINNHNGVIVL